MTKVISMLAIAICMVSTSVNAQEKQKETSKKNVRLKKKNLVAKKKKQVVALLKKQIKKHNF